MDEVLASSLRDAVHQRLEDLDMVATNGDLSSRAALADTEILRLTAAWRAVLSQHAPDQHGRCPQCSGWRRHRVHPCSVWTTAHQYLIVADVPSRSGAGRHATASGRTNTAAVT
jgi:hypothetical protein